MHVQRSRLAAGTLVLAAVVVSAVVSWSAPVEARFSGANGKIVFTSSRTGNFDIYVMNADGSGQTPLTSGQAFDGDPVWSPDGSKIAFDRFDLETLQFDIYVMNADGTGQTNVTNGPDGDMTPAWSPDGSKIALTSTGGSNFDIYVMNADGSGKTNVSNDPASSQGPRWSPDGSKIAFQSNRDGNWEVYVMNADGSGQTNLSNHPDIDGGPSWSPDGSKIVFRSMRDGNNEIYVMNPDGSGQTNLTNTPSTEEAAAAWSPDGSKIAFGCQTGNVDVCVMNADGTDRTNLTNHPATDGDPHWQWLDPQTVDRDGDGCSDGQEKGPDPESGGQRDPENFWDFLDVWTESPPQRDKTVGVGDISAVVQRFGATQDPPPTKQEALAGALAPPPPAPAYHASFDRGLGSFGTTVTPPDGAIAVSDILAVVSQFGHSCL